MKFRSLITLLLPIILCQLFHSRLYSQVPNLSFERFSTEDGLPNDYVNVITQDREGFIWIGTQEGLAKYDGYHFRTFRNIPRDSTSLINSRIEALYVDLWGNLWVGTSIGLNRYRQECDCFIRYAPHLAKTNNVPTGQINTFTEDQNKNLWIGTQEGGLFRYDRNKDKFTRFLDDPNDPNSLVKDQVRVLLADKNNYLWIGTGEPFDPSITGGGLIRFHLGTEVSKRFLHNPANPNSLVDNRVSALLEDVDGRLLVGTGKSGLHYYNQENEEFIRMTPDSTNQLYAPQANTAYLSASPHIRFLHQTQNGAFWIGTFGGGLNYFPSDENKPHNYTSDLTSLGSLVNNLVWSFHEDRHGRLWIGSDLGGIYKLDPSLNKFKIYLNKPKEPNSLSFNEVRGVYEAPREPGIIWLGTNGGGLNRLELSTGRFTQFRHDISNENTISSDVVWATFEDENGFFWVGTEKGLDRMDRKTGKFEHYTLELNTISGPASNPVMRIFEDKNGFLWIGTWANGLIRFDRKKKVFKHFNFSNGSLQTYDNSVYVIEEDSHGKLWVGTWLGALYQYDPQNESFTPKLEGYGAICLHEDRSGWFWVGTQNDGLLYFNPENDSIHHYTVEDGLPSNNILSLVEDDHGYFWISTGNGLSKFDPKSKKVTNYDVSDGLPNNSFNPISAYKTKNGQLLFGGNGGLVSFFSDQVKDNIFPPEVLIRDLQISGEDFKTSKNPFNQNEEITLSYKQNDLTFDYVGLHYTDPSRNQYRYKMEPYDLGWIEAGNQRTARYTNLSPGKYTFKVIASNSDGLWNEEAASVQIYIRSPWWQTWWAYISFGALILMLLYITYRFQINKTLIEAESIRLKELNQLKSRLYTNITHEFRTPLTIILGVTEHVKNQVQKNASERLEVVQRNGQQLLELINQLLDLSKLEAQKIELNSMNGDVVNFLRYLTESFQSMAEYRGIQLHFLTDLEEFYMDYDANRLKQIFFNLISNALKFTPDGGNVYLQISQHKTGYIEFKVKDTGVGIKEEELSKIFDRFYQIDATNTHKGEGTGIGLALVKELVKLMGADIHVKSKKGKGTEFILTLPVKNVSAAKVEHQSKIEIIQPIIPKKKMNRTSPLADAPRILIIEDNNDVREYLINCLGSHFHIETALDGEEGIQRALKLIPDLIVSDVMMPKKNGLEVCDTLKKDRKTSHIPIILLTAKGDMQSKLEGLQYGADLYLNKPFHEEELVLCLNNLLEQRERLKNHYLFISGLSNKEPEDVQLPESTFVKQVQTIIEEHINNPEFTVNQLSKEVALSVSHLHRKLTAITGYSAIQMIRLMRLNKAKQLLRNPEMNISDIAYDCGFSNPDYFSRIFKKEFGLSPSEFRKIE